MVPQPHTTARLSDRQPGHAAMHRLAPLVHPTPARGFTFTLRRALARQAGLTAKTLAAQMRVSFTKVAEYQRRGVVHFHAIIRLDGPAGPVTGPPTRERWDAQPNGAALHSKRHADNDAPALGRLAQMPM